MFNLTDVKETGDFSVLPKGEYLVICRESELKDTKAGDGKYIKVMFEIVSQEYNGRKLWHNFNVVNPNDMAQKIGLGQLKSFLLSSGVKPEQLNSVKPHNLVGQGCVVKVTTKTDSYGEKNEITSFKPEEKASVPAPAAKKKPSF